MIYIPEHKTAETFEEERELRNEPDIRPKEYTPQQIRKLAVDLKERMYGFLTAAFRNKETTNLIDYNKGHEFLLHLDSVIDILENNYPNTKP
jgi:hypothetical protein